MSSFSSINSYNTNTAFAASTFTSGRDPSSAIMLSSAPSIAARQCFRLRPRSSVQATKRSTLTTASPLVCHRVGSLHTTAARAQAVEVASRSHSASLPAANQSETLIDVARRAQAIFDPHNRILGPEWSNRVESLMRKAQQSETATSHDRALNRVVIVGSSLSQTQQLLAAMIDEPLREISGAPSSEVDAILTALSQSAASEPFTIKYAPGPSQLLAGNIATLDRHWLQQASLEVAVLVDPVLSETTYDLLYDSEAILFVTDDYALSRSAHRSRSAGERGDATHELLSRFAAKPNVRLVVNSILGSDQAQVVHGLEAATGASVSDLVAPSLISVRISDALAANSALRQALEKQQQPPARLSTANTAYWDNFSSLYQRSNVGSIINLFSSLDSRQGSSALIAQSSSFLLQHCLDEALATAQHNLATLHQLRSLASEASEREGRTLKQSLERIWPPSTAYTGQLSNDGLKVWRPATPGSLSAVDQAMQETDQLIESAFAEKLQWWKLVWKVDDVRKELETACAGFAAGLESDLAYESGRLATMQLEEVRRAERLLARFEELTVQVRGVESVRREAMLVANEADGYRSRQLRSIEPESLMAPIHKRRAQLLEVGGPIDVIASKSRNLAVTSSAAAAVTAAGVGSASVLGSSLGLIDASSAALALDPSTGLGLGLLTLTLVGWRMQGKYNKFRQRFRDDWQRLSEGLDQDLRVNFERVLEEQITGPERVVSQRIATLAQQWANEVVQKEAHVRNVAQHPPHPLNASTQPPPETSHKTL